MCVHVRVCACARTHVLCARILLWYVPSSIFPPLLVLQIPQIVYSLQKSVQAVLLGGVVESDWTNQGVPSKSLIETWSLASEVPIMSTSGSVQHSITGDGNYLFLHGSFGLLKIGSGYGNKERVSVMVESQQRFLS